MTDCEPTIENLKDEISDLRAKLAESEEVLRAIREGEIDALVVSAEPGERVYTLHGADVIYRTIIETMNEGAVTLAADGTILYCNRLFARLLGATPEDVIGTSIYDYIVTGETAVFDDLIGPRLNGGLRGEFALKTVAGDKRPVFISVSRLDLGDEQGFGLIVTDLAEQKRKDRERAEELERVVEERTRELAEANRELDAYARTVSHDLRSPLATIILSNELLRDALETPDDAELRSEVTEATGVIGRSISQSFSLIEDLLALAESGQTPVKVTDVQISSVIARVLEEHTGEIADRNIELRVDESLGTVKANETQVYQLLSNLIGNAIKHNDDGQPVIDVKLLGEGQGEHRYLVGDNSSGIPEDMLDTVFVPFTSASRKMGSRGIGLAIAKKIVEVYGGHIRAYNDNGARFEFSLRDWES